MALDDLIAWLSAQLGHDERIARRAADAHEGAEGWRFVPGNEDVEPAVFMGKRSLYSDYLGEDGALYPSEVEHIACFDPKRVLREVDAKREIVGRWADLIAEVAHWRSLGDEDAAPVATEWAYRQVVQQLARPYADRPGYREEWRLA